MRTAQFSELGSGLHIRPHCGSTNDRLVLHLGIDVQDGATTAGEGLEMVVADEVGGSLRPIMVPSPLLRFMQRIDMVLHHREVRTAFEGWQYGACLPGGTECLEWIARLCWDNQIPFCVGDVPNGFPGCKHSEVLKALKALLPCMVPSFLRWSERGYRAYGPGHKLIDLVVGGHTF